VAGITGATGAVAGAYIADITDGKIGLATSGS